LVGEVGLEPTKAKPADLQSAPFAARDTPPAPNPRCSGQNRQNPATRQGFPPADFYGEGALKCQPQKLTPKAALVRTRRGSRRRDRDRTDYEPTAVRRICRKNRGTLQQRISASIYVSQGFRRTVRPCCRQRERRQSGFLESRSDARAAATKVLLGMSIRVSLGQAASAATELDAFAR
jgi:hypothetical protein